MKPFSKNVVSDLQIPSVSTHIAFASIILVAFLIEFSTFSSTKLMQASLNRNENSQYNKSWQLISTNENWDRRKLEQTKNKNTTNSVRYNWFAPAINVMWMRLLYLFSGTKKVFLQIWNEFLKKIGISLVPLFQLISQKFDGTHKNRLGLIKGHGTHKRPWDS